MTENQRASFFDWPYSFNSSHLTDDFLLQAGISVSLQNLEGGFSKIFHIPLKIYFFFQNYGL